MNIKTWMLQILSFISFFLFTLLFSPQLLAEKIELVADLNKSPIGGWAGKNITVYQNKVYFTADDSVIGDELYVHDPATNQTTLVKDINIGEGGSDSHDFIIYEEILYFFAFDGEAYNLYSFTSESNGLTKVQSLDYTKVGAFDTVPHALTVYRGKLYFLHQNFFSNILMVYDPKSSLVITISGAYGYTDRFSYNQFRGMVVVSDKLYFIIANDGPYNEMLFFDEDIGKVQRFDSIEGVGRVDSPGNMNEFDGQLVYSDHNELYAFQPQTNELILLFSLPSYIDNLFIDKNNNKFYFSSKDEKYGEELFEYDVTTKQVRLVADINKGAYDSSPKSLTAYGNSLYFTAMSEVYGRELYVYNTVSDVVTLASDALNGKASSDPQYLTKHLDDLYFQVSRKGGYLAKFNTVSGEINTLLSFDGKNTSGSNPDYFVEYRNKLYFSAIENDFEGKKIFSLDKDTSVVKKVSEHTMYSQGIVYQDKLYFRSYEHPYGYELFSYDDQTELTTLVVDIGPEGTLDYDSSRPEVVFNNKLYFTASNRREGENNIRKKLYVYDANTGETTLVSNDYVIGSSLTLYQEKLYFSASDHTTENEYYSQYGYELYAYDSVSNQIKLVKDINLTAGPSWGPADSTEGSSPRDFFIDNEKLYFTADDDINGRRQYYYSGETMELFMPESDFAVEKYPYFLTKTSSGFSMNFTDISNMETSAVNYQYPDEYSVIRPNADFNFYVSSSITRYKNQLYFMVSNSYFRLYLEDEIEEYITGKNDLFRYDIVKQTIERVIDDETSMVVDNLNSSLLFEFGNKLYFSGLLEGSGLELFSLFASEPVTPLNDFDGDGIADETDTDDDNDGVLDSVDAFPLDATRSNAEEIKEDKSSGGSFGVLIFWIVIIRCLGKKRMSN